MKSHALFLAPHNDDEILFGAFTIQRLHPTVVVVYRSAKQGALGLPEVREEETMKALGLLVSDMVARSTYRQWPWLDSGDHEDGILDMLTMLRDENEFEHVFAPAVEDAGGHPQHDLVGRLAWRVFSGRPAVTLTPYRTYVNGRSRTTGREKLKPTGQEIARKLRALSVYESQLALESTAHHFLGSQDEWLG